MLSVGDRLKDFKILIGNNFTPGDTGAAEIESWSECAHFPGKQLFYFIFHFHEINTWYKFKQ